MAPCIVALLLPQLAAAGEPDQPDQPDQIEVGDDHDPSIYGGTAVQTCGWPTTVYLALGNSACTGTLVHPNIVVTAAHCATVSGRPATAHFGEGFGGGARQVSGTCYANPGYTGSSATDYGYCKLNQSVTDVPIIPPAWGCDTAALTPGREVVIVGFGQSNNGGSGSKREVTTTINAVGEQASIGGGGKDSCQGDSGGPVFIKLKSEFGGDDTWRVFGITSAGGACGTGGVYALMHKAIPWIEMHSGIDITPCQDAQGDWAPTPDCGGIPLDPANTNGATWANGCSGGPVSGFVGLCGEPFGSGEDDVPPTAQIVAPFDGQVFELPEGSSQAGVTVTVDADDEGFGVAEVRVLINGADFNGNVDTSAPYTWNLVFPKGGFTIEAIATDWAGNESIPDLVKIGVGQDPPGLSGDDDGDSDSAGDGDGDAAGEGEGDGGAGEDGPFGPGETGGFGGTTYDATITCACSTDADERSGGALGLLGLLGLAGLRRRRG